MQDASDQLVCRDAAHFFAGHEDHKSSGLVDGWVGASSRAGLIRPPNFESRKAP